MEQLVERLEAVVARLETVIAGGFLEAMSILEKAVDVKEFAIKKQRQANTIPLPVKRWQRVGESKNATNQMDCRNLVQQKIQLLKNSSSLAIPICFRCTNSGHLAKHCTNAVVCFVCNRLGHRAAQCRATTELPRAGDNDFGTGNRDPVRMQVSRPPQDETMIDGLRHSAYTVLENKHMVLEETLCQLQESAIMDRCISKFTRKEKCDGQDGSQNNSTYTTMANGQCIDQRGEHKYYVGSMYKKEEPNQQMTHDSTNNECVLLSEKIEMELDRQKGQVGDPACTDTMECDVPVSSKEFTPSTQLIGGSKRPRRSLQLQVYSIYRKAKKKHAE